jgi:hypothetical protein
VGNLTLRQAVLQGPQMGPLKGIMQLAKPTDSLITTMLEQMKMLEAYKTKYGDI